MPLKMMQFLRKQGELKMIILSVITKEAKVVSLSYVENDIQKKRYGGKVDLQNLANMLLVTRSKRGWKIEQRDLSGEHFWQNKWEL